ncbi:hypothetical protein RCG19_21040 [Neobacillus sp. OS1-2]|uniref:hypothetical protein n=1 Tax=Neobacillus sp. OS1-2 TaxID=3070680 RepID=UPI0027E02518|nr:hypothetical protein [Neobacillus sp. OS1-2]WML39630.1 hypothetical protein RCG19_21040 [Neobacillus sp. OS1-2]
MKIHTTLIIIILLMLTSCQTKNDEVGGKLNSKEDILYLKVDDKNVTVSKNMELLNKSDKVATSSEGAFTKVLSFIPNDEYLRFETVRGDKFSYIKLAKSKSVISGKLVYENNTKKNINVQSIFLQGNKNVEIKPASSSKWTPSIGYDVPPYTSIKIDIDLKWDKNGMQELTFFPLEKNSDAYRYNGSILSSYRYFVQSKDININKEMLQEQAFSLKEMTPEQNYFPEPDWIGKNNKDLEYSIEEKVPLTNEKINGLKLEVVPYNTTIDILLVDEYGNCSLIAENVKVIKNKPTYINIHKDDLHKMYKKSTRKFLLIMNNREESIMADVKTIEINKKPFPTSFQRVIEIYKSKTEK